MSLWQTLIGHDWAVELLRSAIEHERVGHAYLFTGPAGIGKTTLARLFAQALNCTAPAGANRPCGQCRACRLIAAGRHPDVITVEPEHTSRGTELIKIETIRELQRGLNLTAGEARYKVAILRRFDTANLSAANAFLKTLEEPPGNVVLLLTALDAEGVLPTIRSRCRLIPLRPLPVARVQQRLEDRGLPLAEARHLAHLSAGRLGWAIRVADDAALSDQMAEQLDWLQEALDSNRVERFALAERLAGGSETLPPLLETWQGWWRDLMLLKTGQGQETLNHIDELERLLRLAGRLSLAQILASLKQTREALWQLEHNANARLVVENLLLVYPVISSP